jgi:hypothetical protein
MLDVRADRRLPGARARCTCASCLAYAEFIAAGPDSYVAVGGCIGSGQAGPCSRPASGNFRERSEAARDVAAQCAAGCDGRTHWQPARST